MTVLWVDDLREPPDNSWVWVTTPMTAIWMLEHHPTPHTRWAVCKKTDWEGHGPTMVEFDDLSLAVLTAELLNQGAMWEPHEWRIQ